MWKKLFKTCLKTVKNDTSSLIFQKTFKKNLNSCKKNTFLGKTGILIVLYRKFGAKWYQKNERKMNFKITISFQKAYFLARKTLCWEKYYINIYISRIIQLDDAKNL